jgi:hypothetical protein
LSELLIFQSLWATERRIPGVPEAPIEQRFDAIAEAGFDGLSLDLGAISLDEARHAVGHYKRTGLRGLVTAFPQSIEDLRPAIHLAKAIGAPFVVVVGQIMPVAVADMIPVVRAWLTLAREEGMPLQFETHRGSITNDLLSTLQLLEAIPELVLSADLSHYVVDRELYLPAPERELAFFDKVIVRAGSFQGRVATGQHIQVPLHFPQHKPWLELFTRWWRQGFETWRRNAPGTENLVFLCELGPAEYAITGADGLELSDRAAEALQLAAIARACWDATADRASAA